MAEFDARPLAVTGTVAVWDVICAGARRQRSDEECAADTHLVFPYRGAYVQHVGRVESVAEANQAIVINADEPYRVSHPVHGGDAVLSVGVSPAALLELTSREYLRGGPRQRRLVNRAKLAMAADLGRRWTLAEITAEVGGSPVYLTQLFQQLEGVPLYRYQLQLRLARALALLGDYDDLSLLALDLGFSSHSHFSASFKAGVRAVAVGVPPIGAQGCAHYPPHRG
jgi:AraC family transcriptional regulator